MELPTGINNLITRVLEANPNAIVVTQGGTPFNMTWHENAKALVHAWYGGNEIGNGIADVLFGDVNPSAKLPLSWPFSLKDNPSYLNSGSTNGRVLYGEDIYVGYKYYDCVCKDVLFQFGLVEVPYSHLKKAEMSGI
jgi:beta-glucosidase